MRVALYARISTNGHGQDVTMQTRELREYAERRGWTVAGEYVDVGISGSKERRPALDRLMGVHTADASMPSPFGASIAWRGVCPNCFACLKHSAPSVSSS